MPDLTKQQKIDGLTTVIENWKQLAETGRKPGIGNYAVKRVPELEAALERHLNG